MKKDYRKLALARRAAIPADERARKSRIITDLVLALPELRTAQVVTVYVDFRSEVETRHLIQQLLDLGKTVALPVAHFDTWELSFTAIPSLDCLIETEKHLLEPAPGAGVDIPTADIDLILTPGAAFSRQGYRLGYGGGFYDRLLEKRRPGTPALALAFTEQLDDALPVDDHDQRLDGIITDSGILRF